VATAIGTPYYLSPEICMEKPYDHKSDIWGVGCILYEMMELHRPFEASSLKGLVLKIVNGVFPSVSTEYSFELIGILKLMLSKDPTKRPSIVEILEIPLLKNKIGSVLANSVKKYEASKNSTVKQIIN